MQDNSPAIHITFYIYNEPVIDGVHHASALIKREESTLYIERMSFIELAHRQEINSAVQEMQQVRKPVHISLILPAEHVRMITLRVPQKQLHYLSDILPGLLEDQVSEPLDDLHVYPTIEEDKETVHCALVKKRMLAFLLDHISFDFQLQALIPEFDCIAPQQEHDVSVLVGNQRATFSLSPYKGFAVSLANAAFAITTMQADYAKSDTEAPKSYCIYYKASDEKYMIWLRDILQETFTQAEISYRLLPCNTIGESVLRAHTRHQVQPCNLLAKQGHQKQRNNTSSATLTQRWLRIAMIIIGLEMMVTLAVALLFYVTGSVYGYRSQQLVDQIASNNNTSTAPYEDVAYAISSGQGAGASSQFIPFFEQALSVFPRETLPSVKYLRFDAEDQSLAMRLALDNITALQEYNEALQQAGYSVDVSASNNNSGSGGIMATVQIRSEFEGGFE